MDRQDWLDDFSFNLRALIRETGVSQTELAMETGISKSTLSRYVNGQAMPTCDAVINLARALDCDIDDLMDISETIE